MSAWLPDGRGLDPLSLDIAAEHNARVHLRLTLTPPPDAWSSSSQSACDQALGELWTGVGSEVTCPACLEVVHA